MPQKISNLLIGSRVRDDSTKYNGKPIVWRIVDKNHDGYPDNTVTLIADRILTLKAFDAMESKNPDSDRRSYGNNNYRLSNLRQWLNSEEQTNWFRIQHNYDAPPTAENVWDHHNPYANEAGFLYNFSQDMKNAILDTTLKVAKNTVTDGGGFEKVRDKIFLASSTEVGLANENGIGEGTKLAFFEGNDSRKAIPTEEAVFKSTYQNASLNSSAPWWWFLRTPNAADSYRVRGVNSSGELSWYYARYGNDGVRPLCNLKSEIQVSDKPDEDGIYVIQWNEPPTEPTGIHIDGEVRIDKDVTISWGPATDPEGKAVSYSLERKADEAEYQEIYRGINRYYTDHILQGWATVQYRVKAYDSYGAVSKYVESEKKVVSYNHDPVISSAEQEDMGEKTGPFNLQYTATDTDAGQTITVTEEIDGVVKKTFQAGSGVNYAVKITKEEWQKTLNGTHTIRLVAVDSAGGKSEKTFKFTKNEGEILFELKEPLPADDMITKGLLTILGNIPSGAKEVVEITNNGYDDEPTWQDVTNQVKRGEKIFFTNERKTAKQWGFNVRVHIERESAEGDCFISSIGGNFE